MAFIIKVESNSKAHNYHINHLTKKEAIAQALKMHKAYTKEESQVTMIIKF